MDKELLPVSCLDLELSIMREFDYRRNVIVPNISSQMNIVAFETDILLITKNNMAYGFEIKVSKSDLKADFKKHHHVKINETIRGKSGLEHFFGKFKYFYYTVPEQLKEDALLLIPEFCGLWCLKKHNNGRRIVYEFYEVRKPKKLFNYKWSNELKYEVARLGCMRIYTLKTKITTIKK